MATTRGGYLDSEVLEESAPLVAGVATCTALLTAAFLGVVGLLSGSVVGIVARLPLYVLAGSVSFVVVLFLLDDPYSDGSEVLAQSATAGVVTFVLVTLGTEGVVYALTNPEAVVASHLFVYILSAAIIATGLGYWGMRNWHDVRGAVDAGQL